MNIRSSESSVVCGYYNLAMRRVLVSSGESGPQTALLQNEDQKVGLPLGLAPHTSCLGTRCLKTVMEKVSDAPR